MVDVTAEDVLLDVKHKLDSTRTRTIDLFRKIDQSGDGSASAGEFRTGLAELGFTPSDHEFSVLLAQLDKDGSGDVTLKEFDRALRQVEKQAMTDGRPGAQAAVARAAASAKRRVEKQHQEQKEKLLQQQEQQRPQRRGQEPLPPMDRGDEVLCGIKGMLNKRKTRMVDVFRTIDKSGDGIVSTEEFRSGLEKLGFPQSDDDFAAIMATLDKDGSGDISVKEFDKALKLAEKKARAEGRAAEVDTWGAACSVPDSLQEKYNWSRRSLKTDRSGTLSVAGSEILTPRGESWHSAAAGPLARACSSKLGCGSIQDSSIHRQRILDTAGAPNSLPPTLKTPGVPTYKTTHKQPVFAGRFEKHLVNLPSEDMVTTHKQCTTSTQGSLQQLFDRGVRKYQNTPMMQSTVDQVVFNRDMDFSGEDKFDEEFTSMFIGMAGQPSWHVGR